MESLQHTIESHKDIPKGRVQDLISMLEDSSLKEILGFIALSLSILAICN